MKEFLVSLFVHFLENLLLISPLLFLYAKASERHLMLKQTIGPNRLEERSMDLIQKLAVGAVAIITICIPLQLLLFWMYNYYGHPWKRLLVTDALVSEDNLQNIVLDTVQKDDKRACSNMDSNLNNVKYDIKQQDSENLEPSSTNHSAEETKKDIKMEGRNFREISTQENTLEEAYEIIEKQLESLRLLKR